MRVVRRRCIEFLEEMDAKKIARKLADEGLITKSVECQIKESNSKEEANFCLLSFLKLGASTDQVQNILKYAAEVKGDERMNAFAARILQEIQQGLQ